MQHDAESLLREHYFVSAAVLVGEELALLQEALKHFDNLESWVIFCTIFHRAMMSPETRALSIPALLAGEVAAVPSLGTNVRSIAASLGIPRETVRRRVCALVERGWVERRGKQAILVPTPKAMVELSGLRDQFFRGAGRIDELLGELRRRSSQENLAV